MKVGLMGCGAVADFGHLPAITATNGVELHAVYDPNPERAQQAAEKFGAGGAFSGRDAFFDSGLDAVVISSPPATHRENVLEAAARRLPVLCEKPIAMNDADATVMIEAMERAGVPLVTGFCYRFSQTALDIYELVRNGAIGEVRSLRLIYIWNLHGIYEWDSNGQPYYSPARKARMDEGGPMVDCGVHQIDLACWWLGKEVVAQSSAGAWVENYEAPDHVYLHLDHEGGPHTMIETSFTYCHTAKDPISHFTYQLIGTEGLIRYDRESGVFELRGKNGTDWRQWHHEKNFEGMHAAFAEAVQTGNLGMLATGRDGLIATQIARKATDDAILRRKSLTSR